MDKWTGMSISEDKLNGLWCWFVIAFKFLTETYPKNQINHLISIYHMTCSFLMGAFKKCSKTGKNAIYNYQSTWGNVNKYIQWSHCLELEDPTLKITHMLKYETWLLDHYVHI